MVRYGRPVRTKRFIDRPVGHLDASGRFRTFIIASASVVSQFDLRAKFIACVTTSLRPRSHVVLGRLHQCNLPAGRSSRFGRTIAARAHGDRRRWSPHTRCVHPMLEHLHRGQRRYWSLYSLSLRCNARLLVNELKGCFADDPPGGHDQTSNHRTHTPQVQPFRCLETSHGAACGNRTHDLGITRPYPLAQELAFSLRLLAEEREQPGSLTAPCGCSGAPRGHASPARGRGR